MFNQNIRSGTPDYSNSPRLQWRVITSQKLLATKIPATGKPWSHGHFLAKQHRRRVKNASLGLHHVAVDFETVIIKEGIAIPFE